jgi:hypothetical protein
MAHWQASFTREPPKTKDELRQMLTDAVRNTQPSTQPRADQEPQRPSKAKAIVAGADSAD